MGVGSIEGGRTQASRPMVTIVNNSTSNLEEDEKEKPKLIKEE